MTALLTDTVYELTTRLGEELSRREGERLRRQVLRDLVGSTDALAGIILSAWTWLRETLEGEGFQGQELARHCQLLRDGIDGSLAGYERLLALAEASGLPPNAAGLDDLKAKLPALREARPKVAEVLTLTTRPTRPIDEGVLAQSRTALERGDFVALDEECLARLRAGEDF